MGKNLRHGRRFNSGSIIRTDYVPRFRTFELRAPAADTKLGHIQKQSVKFRERRGIEPSLPHFSIEGPRPEPPPEPEPPDYLQIAEAIYYKWRCKAIAVLSQHKREGRHHVVVTMEDEGVPFTICINANNNRVLWTEGKAPYISRNGAAKRKDC